MPRPFVELSERLRDANFYWRAIAARATAFSCSSVS